MSGIGPGKNSNDYSAANRLHRAAIDASIRNDRVLGMPATDGLKVVIGVMIADEGEVPRGKLNVREFRVRHFGAKAVSGIKTNAESVIILETDDRHQPRFEIPVR